MKGWARQHDVQINQGIYFDKSTMEDIVCMEFCPLPKDGNSISCDRGTGHIHPHLLPMSW
jgi:hypothetical protein